MQQEKMASIGQLAAGVAHEINNPMGFISSNMTSLEKYEKDLSGLIIIYKELVKKLLKPNTNISHNPEIKSALKKIETLENNLDIDFLLKDIPTLLEESLDGADRIIKIVQNLKDFAHPGSETPEYVDITENIESTLNIVGNELKYKAQVTKEFDELPPVFCYPRQLNQVFMNLLVNAAQAINERGEIKISTKKKDDKIELKFSDTGSGIPEEVLPKIFDPFFTTKEVGKGTGLGLNLTYNIIKKHKGEISVQSKEGEGTIFTIILPIDPDLQNK